MKKILIVLIIIALLVGFYFLFIYDNNKPDNFKLSDNIKTKDNINFSLDLSHHKKGDVEEYKFSDNLKIKLEFIGVEDFDSLNYYRYKLSINDNYVLEDGTTGDTRLISIVNKSIICKYDQNTDERNMKILVYSYSGNKMDEIYELEKEKGMVPNKYEINDGKLVITGSRIKHKYSLEYDDKSYELCGDKIKKIDDIPVVKEYIYDVSKEVNKESEKTLQTLTEYLKNNKCS